MDDRDGYEKAIDEMEAARDVARSNAPTEIRDETEEAAQDMQSVIAALSGIDDPADMTSLGRISEGCREKVLPMQTTTQLHPDHLTVLARDEGEHVHALDNLATFKATAGETGALAAVEFTAPRGFGPPLHCHRDEDELVVVLDGEIAFRSGETEIIASDGACAYLPHGIPHTFQVLSDTARMISVTARVSDGGAPRFDAMFRALGEPAATPTLPAPMDIDPGHVAMVCDQHGIDVLGPPPAPLAD